MNQKKVKAIKEYLAPARAVMTGKNYRKLLKITKRASKGVPRKEYENGRNNKGENADMQTQLLHQQRDEG